jgi:hypothetical protein
MSNSNNSFKALKGVWWMPWLWETMKDVVSCDKLRGAAHKRYIRRFPNGTTQHTEGVLSIAIWKSTLWTETSKEEEEKKIIMIPWVVASEKGRAQTCVACYVRVVGPHLETNIKLNFLESWTIAGDSPVGRNCWGRVESWVRRDRRNPAWICRHHPVRLNTSQRPIVNQYRKGKVKSTLNKGVK